MTELTFLIEGAMKYINIASMSEPIYLLKSIYIVVFFLADISAKSRWRLKSVSSGQHKSIL